MTRIRATLLAAFLTILALAQLTACTGGGSSYGPMIDLSGPHSPALSQGGGGPASVSLRGGPGADTVP
jgi:hypothetical protein